jgi:PAS domain S-box-containing protein
VTITNAAGAGTAAQRQGPGRPRRRDTAVLLAAFAVLVAVEAAYVAFVYLPGGRAAAVAAWQGRLAAIADDREAALAAWAQERTGDARVVAAYPTVVALAAAGAGAVPPASTGEGTHLSGLLDEIVKAYRYRGAYVLDARGAEVAQSGGSAPLGEACLAAARAALAERGTRIDFYLDPGGTAVIAVIAPVLAAGARPGAAPAPVGAVVLTADPGVWVYPMLLAQPVPTSSGEAVLVRREGARVRFLSPLRYRNAAPLTYSRPLDTPGFAAQEVVEGHEGFFAYTDYRGAPVFAATRLVAGTPWGLVAKVDRAEALAPFGERARATAIFLGLITAALALAGFGFWRSRRARYEAALARSEARFAHLFEHANDAVVVSRPDGRIVAVNPRAEALYGYPRGELLAMAIRDLRAPQTLPQLAGQLRQVLDGKGLVFETVHVANDGGPIPVEVSSRRIEWDDGPALFSLVRDIRERRAAEERIRFLNRLLRTISEVNQLVVRERDRGALFAETCRILVEHGEFHMAWIGLAEPESGRVRPVAVAGFEEGYLTAHEVRFDDSPAGRGPTGTAIRERRPVVANDWEGDERVAPWRAAGRERGYRASAAVPLETAGVAVGAVTVYADRSGVFTDEVVTLLAELAGDLSFALDAIEAERQKAATLAALAASEARFRELFGRIGSGVVVYEAVGDGDDFVVRGFNPAAERIEKIEAAAVIGRRVTEAFPSVVEFGLFDVLRRVWRSGEPQRHPVAIYRDERIEGWRENQVYKLPSGEVVAVYEDATERKRAEAEIRRLNADLERRIAERTAELAAANQALRRSEEQFRGAADGSLDAFFLLRAVRDGEGAITDFEFVHANPRAAEILDLPAAAVVGRKLCELLPINRTAGFFDKYVHVVESREPLDEEFSIEAPHFTASWIQHQVVAVGDGVAVTSRNITGRKCAEEAIRSLNADLERRAGELEAANKELEAFSYSVSHDLRAPLRAIDGFSRLVEEEYGGRLDDEGRRLLRVVRDSTHKMAQLIDDLLAFSRSARHPLQPSRIDMGALARSVFEELVPGAARAGCDFTVGALPDAMGDAAMMHQVWTNLLANAVKFTRPVSQPRIAIDGRVEGSEVVYTVSDNGVGFDMTYAGKLFGVFQRLHPAREFEGTGVGLALVQRIVHRHGGRVWADGAVGKGATFSFALPAPGGVS